jgi:hypothetical protein
MQEYVSGAGEHPEAERLPTSVRQRASEIERYGLSIPLLLEVDPNGRGSTEKSELLYGNTSSTSHAWNALRFSMRSNKAPKRSKVSLFLPDIVTSVLKVDVKGRNVPAWYP